MITTEARGTRVPSMERNMRTAGSYQFPPMDSVIYGKPAAEALREEAERLDARRVFLIASRTLNSKTDEIEKIRKSLSDRYAGTFDGTLYCFGITP